MGFLRREKGSWKFRGKGSLQNQWRGEIHPCHSMAGEGIGQQEVGKASLESQCWGQTGRRRAPRLLQMFL